MSVAQLFPLIQCGLWVPVAGALALGILAYLAGRQS